MTQILFSNYSHREKNWKKSKCDKLQHIKWKWIFDTVWRRKKTHTEQIPNSFDGRTFLSLLSKRKSLAITLLRLMAKRSESIMNVIHIPQMQFGCGTVRPGHKCTNAMSFVRNGEATANNEWKYDKCTSIRCAAVTFHMLERRRQKQHTPTIYASQHFGIFPFKSIFELFIHCHTEVLFCHL